MLPTYSTCGHCILYCLSFFSFFLHLIQCIIVSHSRSRSQMHVSVLMRPNTHCMAQHWAPYRIVDFVRSSLYLLVILSCHKWHPWFIFICSRTVELCSCNILISFASAATIEQRYLNVFRRRRRRNFILPQMYNVSHIRYKIDIKQ